MRAVSLGRFCGCPPWYGTGKPPDGGLGGSFDLRGTSIYVRIGDYDSLAIEEIDIPPGMEVRRIDREPGWPTDEWTLMVKLAVEHWEEKAARDDIWIGR